MWARPPVDQKHVRNRWGLACGTEGGSRWWRSPILFRVEPYGIYAQSSKRFFALGRPSRNGTTSHVKLTINFWPCWGTNSFPADQYPLEVGNKKVLLCPVKLIRIHIRRRFPEKSALWRWPKIDTEVCWRPLAPWLASLRWRLFCIACAACCPAVAAFTEPTYTSWVATGIVCG